MCQKTNLLILPSVSNNIQPQWLSPMLLSQIPIKHLLEQARRRRREFRGLYAPLLQLINTHLPHLCLVDDWLRQEEVFTAPHLSAASPLLHVQCSPPCLKEGMPSKIESNLDYSFNSQDCFKFMVSHKGHDNIFSHN